MAEVVLHPSNNAASVKMPLLRVVVAPVDTLSGYPSWPYEYVDSYMIPERLTYGMNGQIATLTLRWALGKYLRDWGTAIAPEDVARDYKPGTRIILEHRYMTLDDGRPQYAEWFRGHIAQEGLLIQASPDAESVTFVAYGPEQLLRHKAVHGQWHKTPTQDDLEIAGDDVSGERAGLFITDLPCIFNHKGRPNCSQSAWTTDTAGSGTGGRCFESPGRLVRHPTESGSYRIQAQQWTAYQALVSVIGRFDNGDVIDLADVARYSSTLDTPIDEVVVEGLSLLDAMRAILLPIGYGFYLSPRLALGDSTYAFYVFPLHGGSIQKAGPRLADNASGNVSMTDEEGYTAEVQRLNFLRDSHNVQNEITVIGDRKRVQASFEFDGDSGLLKRAWNTLEYSDHKFDTYADNDALVGRVENAPSKSPKIIGVYEGEGETPVVTRKQAWLDKFCTSGDEFLTHRHVFRTYAANDDGSLSHINAGTFAIADLSDYGYDSTNYVRRARPLGHTLIRDRGTEGFRPAYVTIRIAGVENSEIPLPEAVPLRDHLGFWIRVPDLSTCVPYIKHWRDDDPLKDYQQYTLATLLYNTAEAGSGVQCVLRLVGTIDRDIALTSTQIRSLESAWPFDSQRILYRPGAFKHYSASHEPDALITDTRDDTARIASRAIDVQDVVEDSMGHGSIVLKWINWDYTPGLAVKQTSGRRIDLTVDGSADDPSRRYYPIVSQVTFDFTEGANNTEIVLETPLLKIMR